MEAITLSPALPWAATADPKPAAQEGALNVTDAPVGLEQVGLSIGHRIEVCAGTVALRGMPQWARVKLTACCNLRCR